MLQAVTTSVGAPSQPSVFDKCRAMTERVAIARTEDAYCYFRVIESPQEPEVVVGSRKLVMLGSNNYLGLTNHPKVKEAAVDAVRRFGTGCAGSRLLNGTLTLHEALEAKLARFIGKPAAVTFSTGFQVNLGAISSLLDRGDVVYLDKQDHACIIDGARLSFARIRKFEHNDPGELRRRMKADTGVRGRLVVVDGVFSMEGDISPLPQLVQLAEKYGCIMMIDDAHASGVLGRNGRGTVDHFGMHGRVDIQVGTLSKAIGALGGYVCGTHDLIDFLYHRARPFLFSTSHPPSVAATCIAAFDVLENEPERTEKLWENTHFWKKELGLLGFDIGGRATPASETPITPIIIGDGKLTMDFSRELFKEGVLGTGIAFPTVPEGKARIRTIMTATHTKEELDQALGVLKTVGKRMGILAN